jgi:hypothetical protein
MKSRLRQEAREGRVSVRKVFRLDPRLLAEARKQLGTGNDQEAVEAALDLVVFRSELGAGVRALRGMRLRRLAAG